MLSIQLTCAYDATMHIWRNLQEVDTPNDSPDMQLRSRQRLARTSSPAWTCRTSWLPFSTRLNVVLSLLREVAVQRVLHWGLWLRLFQMEQTKSLSTGHHFDSLQNLDSSTPGSGQKLGWRYRRRHIQLEKKKDSWNQEQTTKQSIRKWSRVLIKNIKYSKLVSNEGWIQELKKL